MSTTPNSKYAEAIAHLPQLSKAEQLRLFSYLRKQLHGSGTIDLGTLTKDIRDKRFSHGFSCPQCKSSKVVRNGQQNGRQTFVCRSCGKYFSEHSLTPMSGLHEPEK